MNYKNVSADDPFRGLWSFLCSTSCDALNYHQGAGGTTHPNPLRGQAHHSLRSSPPHYSKPTPLLTFTWLIRIFIDHIDFIG